MPENLGNPWGQELERLEALRRQAEEMKALVESSSALKENFEMFSGLVEGISVKIERLQDALVKNAGAVSASMRGDIENIERTLTSLTNALSAEVKGAALSAADGFELLKLNLQDTIASARRFPELTKQTDALDRILKEIGSDFETFWNRPLQDTGRILKDLEKTLNDMEQSARGTGYATENLMQGIRGARSTLKEFGETFETTKESTKETSGALQSVMGLVSQTGLGRTRAGQLVGRFGQIGKLGAGAGWVGLLVEGINLVMDAIDDMTARIHRQATLMAVPMGGIQAPTTLGGAIAAAPMFMSLDEQSRALADSLAMSHDQFLSLTSQIKSTGMMFEMITADMSFAGDTFADVMTRGGDHAMAAGQRMMMLTTQMAQFGRAIGMAPDAVIKFTEQISRITGERVVELAMSQLLDIAQAAQRAQMDINTFATMVLSTADQLKIYGVRLETVRDTVEEFGDALRMGLVSMQEMASIVRGMREAPLERMAEMMMLAATAPGVPPEVRQIAQRLMRQGPGGVAAFQALMGGAPQLELLQRTRPEYFQELMRATGAATPEQLIQMSGQLAQFGPMMPRAFAGAFGARGLEAMLVETQMMAKYGAAGAPGRAFATWRGAEDLMQENTQTLQDFSQKTYMELGKEREQIARVEEVIRKGDWFPGARHSLGQWWHEQQMNFFNLLDNAFTSGDIRVQIVGGTAGGATMESGVINLAPPTMPELPTKSPGR
jgi:hypothetical protein